MPFRANNEGVKLIQFFESCKLSAYLDSGGVWTIGWGTTAAANVGIRPKAGMRITQEAADYYFRKTLESVEKDVEKLVKVPLNENQFSALVSFVYNIGAGQFKTSTLLRKLNAGDYEGAATEFPRWNKDNGKVLAGLVKRRAREQALFLKPVEA